MHRLLAALFLVLATAGAAQAQPALHALRGDEVSWASKPTGEQIADVFPDKAMRQSVSGRIMLECQTTKTGSLASCVILSETPRDFGFGAAALKLSRYFRMNAKTADVVLEGGVVELPILLVAQGSQPPMASDRAGDPSALIAPTKGKDGFACSTSTNPTQLCQAHAFYWDKRPARQETAELVRSAAGTTPTTSLVCATTSDQRLVNCTSGPGVSPQQDAAMRGLIAQMTPPVQALDKTPLLAGKVVVEFHWPALREALDASALTRR